MNKPRYIIVAGVNGAGKSTLYQVNPKLFEDTLRVNADEILRKNQGDWQNPKDNIFAGRETVKQIQYNFENRISFHQETTLASSLNGFLKNIQKAKQKGFQVELLYVSLDSPQRAIERVRQRVIKGGHGIPDDVITKRYFKSLENLKSIVKHVDSYQIFENNQALIPIAENVQKSIDNWINEHTALPRKEEILMELEEQQDKEYLKQNILEMKDEDPDLAYGEPHEVIYQIDDIKVYGGFYDGIRGVDHNILVDDTITWEKLLEFGTVVVPETNSYISNKKIAEFENLGYKKLPLDNNHIVGKKNKDIEEKLDLGERKNLDLNDFER